MRTYGEEIMSLKHNKVFLDIYCNDMPSESVGDYSAVVLTSYTSYVSTICVGRIVGVVGSVDVVDLMHLKKKRPLRRR